MSNAAMHPPELIPRRALWLGAGVLVLTLAGAGAFRRWGKATAPADAPVLAQRSLLFRDLPDGGVAIVDAASGRTLDTAHGEQGFLRGTLRALARQRRQRGMSGEAPLLLSARADGRLTLADAGTGALIDLQSFGPNNAAVFVRWLPRGETP